MRRLFVSLASSVGVVVTHGGRALLHNLHRNCCYLLSVQSAALQHDERLRETKERLMHVEILTLCACVGVCMLSVCVCVCSGIR